MNLSKFLSGLLLLFIATSCIQDEALNAECDILEIILENNYLKGEPIIENDRITFLARPDIDLTQLAPEFILTEGATISPLSGTARNFTQPQQYIVSSQDGNWRKTYEIRFVLNELKTRYSFENFNLAMVNGREDNYYMWYESIEETNPDNGEITMKRDEIWATGNPGFKLTGQGTNSDRYPSRVFPDGVAGNGVIMTTRNTGSFGAMVKMPIAAGSLFIGTFDVTNAITNPLAATKFGRPFSKRPVRMKGWYKYQPGANFTDKDLIVMPGKVDELDIYAVFYEPTIQIPLLTGDNVLTADNIIALARLDDRTAKSEWTSFSIPFDFKQEVDEYKLQNFKYNIAVVFTSSIDGAYFEGAVGSELHIDEVEIICDND